MSSGEPITHLFTDVGGVLATNGWDHDLRYRTADHFGVDRAEMDDRHHLTFDTYESGKMPLAAYLDSIIFYKPRPFSRDDVTRYILEQGRAFPDMLELLRQVKHRHGLKVALLSNEGQELTTDRIARFGLDKLADYFIVSGFVHLRKPDQDIFRLALDIAQAPPHRVVYLEDRQLFVDVAAGL